MLVSKAFSRTFSFPVKAQDNTSALVEKTCFLLVVDCWSVFVGLSVSGSRHLSFVVVIHNRKIITMQQSMAEIGFGRDIKLGRWRWPMLGVCTSRNATHVDKRLARSHGL